MECAPNTVWDVITHTLAVLTAVAGALAPVVVPMLPQIINYVGGFFKDARHRRVFEQVSRAGLAAASAGASRMREVLDLAKRPESRGGSEVTDQERHEAMVAAVSAAVTAGMEYLEQSGALKEIVAVYGSEELVKSSIEAMVHHKWFGSSVRIGVVSAPVSAKKLKHKGKTVSQ